MGPGTVTYLADEGGGRIFGPGPYRLLKKVDECGSLSAAARSMGMSYSKALRILKRAEEGLGERLVERRIGGESGGSSSLSAAGRLLMRRFELWNEACSAAARTSFASAFAGTQQVARLGCVVMASGLARRFGRQKLMEPLDGTPMLARVLDALGDPRVETVVTTRDPRVRALCEGRGVRCVLHDGERRSDSVREGMRALGERAGYLFVSGDQPLVSATSVSAVVDEHVRHPSAIVRLAWKDEPGAPVLFPGVFREALLGLEGSQGGLAILRRSPDLAATVRLVQASSPGELMDVDTQDDLARVREALDAAQRAQDPATGGE